MITTIETLHKNDVFKFNNHEYTVKRKWIDDRRPMIASSDYLGEERFYFEGLEVEQIKSND